LRIVDLEPRVGDVMQAPIRIFLKAATEKAVNRLG